jgi:hypothetical protein
MVGKVTEQAQIGMADDPSKDHLQRVLMQLFKVSADGRRLGAWIDDDRPRPRRKVT